MAVKFYEEFQDEGELGFTSRSGWFDRRKNVIRVRQLTVIREKLGLWKKIEKKIIVSIVNRIYIYTYRFFIDIVIYYTQIFFNLHIIGPGAYKLFFLFIIQYKYLYVFIIKCILKS